MTGYLLQRLVALPIVLLGVSLITFGLIGLAPGDPAVVMLRRQGVAPLPEAVQALHKQLGLDAPAPVRYARWLGGALHGDLGRSQVEPRRWPRRCRRGCP